MSTKTVKQSQCNHIRLIWAIAAASSKEYSGKHIRLWRHCKGIEDDEVDVYETKYCPDCGEKLEEEK